MRVEAGWGGGNYAAILMTCRNLWTFFNMAMSGVAQFTLFEAPMAPVRPLQAPEVWFSGPSCE